jgi:hypothetical protein
MWARVPQTAVSATPRITRMPATIRLVASAAVALALAAACSIGGSSSRINGPLPTYTDFSLPAVPSPTPAPTTPATALALLDRMAVKPQASATPFAQSAFGAVRRPPRSSSPCLSTDVVLQRDLVDITLGNGSNCSVVSGALFDMYSARWFWYLHSKPALNQVGIDHVVSLANAWATGASTWTSGELNAFVNDPLELRAAGAQEIAAKGSNDATGWLPANPQGSCWYAVDQVAVKFIYQLWVTDAEKSALVKVLSACPTAPATLRPTTSPPPVPSPTKSVPRKKPKAAPRPPAATPSSSTPPSTASASP